LEDNQDLPFKLNRFIHCWIQIPHWKIIKRNQKRCKKAWSDSNSSLEDNQDFETKQTTLDINYIQIPHWKIIKSFQYLSRAVSPENSNSSLEDNQEGEAVTRRDLYRYSNSSLEDNQASQADKSLTIFHTFKFLIGR